MSSGQSSRNTPPNNRYGSEGDYLKRRKNFHASSTRRDFKSSPNGPSLATSTSASLSSPIAQSNAPLRGEKPNGDYSSRHRFRDSPQGGSSGLSRSSSYSKDSRYASYNNKFPYSSNYYQDRSPGAYGSFSSAKRAESDLYYNYQPSRDANSRDMNAPSSREDSGPFGRDSWRSERPKLSSGNSSKSYSGSRFNPNNMPVTSRSGQSSLSASAPTDYKKDRYDSYDDYNGRWKGGYRADKHERSLSSSAGRPNPTKDRIRSSGLTNSVRSSKRADSYYPSKSLSGSSGRTVDRYTREKSYDDDHEEASSNDHRGQYGQAPYPDRDDAGSAEKSSAIDEESKRDVTMESEDAEEDEDDDEEEEEEDEEEEEELEETEDALSKTNSNLENIKAESAVLKSEADETNKLLNGISNAEKVVGPIVKLTAADIENHIDYPDGCIYPATRLDAELETLRLEFTEHSLLEETKLVKAEPIQDFKNYPFFIYNLQIFAENHESYIKTLQERNASIRKKQLTLWVKYKALWDESEKKRSDMEEQLKVVHPADDESRRELEAIDVRIKTIEPTAEPAVEQPLAPPARRNRRHGDLVTTEAEFQEILKSLKNEQNDDPLSKAKSVSAVIPDLIMDPIEVNAYKFMDSNNFVRDKRIWLDRLQTDFETNFTEKEHDLFCEGFCRAPKRFGEISRHMGGLRSANECVMHYYITKKAVNYKFMVSQYKKRISKKSSRKKKKAERALEDLPPTESVTTETPNSVSAVSGESNTDLPKSPPRESESTSGEEPPKKKARTDTDEITTATVPLSNELPAASEPIEQTSTLESTIIPEPATADLATAETGVVPGMEVPPEASPGDEKKKQITSYWSITEVNEFPHLLNSYGSKWSVIAEKLTTKSATMVRNYFQRNAEKYGWNEIVATADERIARGSDASGVPLSSVDSTIVVKPQKTIDTQTPKTEFNVYDATESNNEPFGTSALKASGPMTEAPQSKDSEGFKAEGIKNPVSTDRTRSSIMSLLNNESSSGDKPDTAGSPVKKEEVTSPKNGGNLASLLNAASSPPRP